MDTLFGLSIGADSVEAVEVQRDGNALRVTAIGEWNRTDASDLPALGDRLRTFVQANAVRSTDVTVALDDTLLVVQTFPVEVGLSRAEWDRHARWERSQFFPSAAKEEFIGDVFPLPPHPSENAQEIMSVSIRREDIRAIRRIVHHAGLELGGVDGAHFCAETLLLEHSQELSDQPALFVAVKKQRIEWSIYERKTLLQYGVRQAEGHGAIADALRGIVQDRHPEQILLHGLGAGPEVQDALRDATGLPVRAFDPFQTVPLTPDHPLAGQFAATSFRFAAAVGAALRSAGAD